MMASSSAVALDDLRVASRHPTLVDDHLFFLTIEKESQSGREASPAEVTRDVLNDRLYIGKTKTGHRRTFLGQ